MQDCPQSVKLSRTAINNVLRKHYVNGFNREQRAWKFFRAKKLNELWQLDLKGTLKIEDQENNTIYTKNDYTCNSGEIVTDPTGEAGIYKASFKLHTEECSVCQKTHYFLIHSGILELETLENPAIQAIICIAILLGLILKTKIKKCNC